MPAQAIQDGDMISRSDSVVAADAMDEAILIDIDSGYFFQLNKSAAHIWGLVEQPRSFVDLCGALRQAFKTAPDSFRTDVAEFVAEMKDRGLLKICRS